MKIQIITPSIVGEVFTDVEDGYYSVSVSLRTPGASKTIYDIECEVAKEIAVEVANHLTAVGHADPLQHDIQKIVYTYLDYLK